MKTKIFTTVIVIIISCSHALAQDKTKSIEKQTSTKTEMANESVYYTCPMHPEIKSDKPGKCPKCGMTLEKKTVKTTGTQNVKKDAMITYTCSMHPEVISDKPGKCPKCGMALIVKK
jgi:hypothetical protein